MNHVTFLQRIAGVAAPPRLPTYLVALAGRGGQVLDPGDRASLHPLIVPLVREPSGAVQGLLRWPTAPTGLPLPVVRQGGEPHDRWTLELVATSVDQALHRELATRDASGESFAPALLDELARAEPLYAPGQFVASGLSLAAYRLLRIGETHAFFEQLAERHLAKQAPLAAQVTADRSIRVAPGWARPMAYRALLLDRLGEHEQARDSAASALADPVWTLGHPFDRVATIAGWQKISGEPFRRLARAQSKLPADRAAHLLDALAVEGGDWSQDRSELAELYAQAGLDAVAALVRAV